jgi:hypothetical protein
VEEDRRDDGGIGEEREDPHLAATGRAQEPKHLDVGLAGGLPVASFRGSVSSYRHSIAAQTDEGPRLRVEGPPAPVAPAVISRDGDGNATVRAIRLTQPIRLDGVLDEPFYGEVPSVSDFIQSLPSEGGEPSERTEGIAFDDSDVYVSARVWESVERPVASVASA